MGSWVNETWEDRSEASWKGTGNAECQAPEEEEHRIKNTEEPPRFHVETQRKYKHYDC